VNVGAVAQTQVRCRECNRRLGDFVNELQAGQVILELKCPKCGRPHLEIIRPSAEPISIDSTGRYHLRERHGEGPTRATP
jgi:phage FluMu protein Com